MLSVIVPAYNAEKYLKRCIDSILNQTLKNIEIIIIDDGSRDNTYAICDIYASRYSNIIVKHQENKGLLATREVGVNIASGALIGFVDADDYVEPSYFEDLLNQMGDADIIACGMIKECNGSNEYITNNIREGLYLSEQDFQELYSEFLCKEIPFEFGLLPYVWNKIFKKSLLISILKEVDKKIFDGEDVAITFPYILNVNSIVISNYCGYHYVIHKDSLSNKKRNIDYYNEACLYEWLFNRFSMSKHSDILIHQLNRYILMMLWKRKPDIYVEANKFIFPADSIPYGANIIIYGNGEVGQCFIKQIEQNKHCKIVACADKKYVNEIKEKGLRYIPPKQIINEKYDSILVAINDKEISENICNDLLNMGIESNNIVLLK